MTHINIDDFVPMTDADFKAKAMVRDIGAEVRVEQDVRNNCYIARCTLRDGEVLRAVGGSHMIALERIHSDYTNMMLAKQREELLKTNKDRIKNIEQELQVTGNLVANFKSMADTALVKILELSGDFNELEAIHDLNTAKDKMRTALLHYNEACRAMIKDIEEDIDN